MLSQPGVPSLLLSQDTSFHTLAVDSGLERPRKPAAACSLEPPTQRQRPWESQNKCSQTAGRPPLQGEMWSLSFKARGGALLLMRAPPWGQHGRSPCRHALLSWGQVLRDVTQCRCVQDGGAGEDPSQSQPSSLK